MTLETVSPRAGDPAYEDERLRDLRRFDYLYHELRRAAQEGVTGTLSEPVSPTVCAPDSSPRLTATESWSRRSWATRGIAA